jgi:hypothetical protein
MAKFIELTLHNEATTVSVNIDHIVFFAAKKINKEVSIVNLSNSKQLEVDLSPIDLNTLIKTARD